MHILMSTSSFLSALTPRFPSPPYLYIRSLSPFFRGVWCLAGGGVAAGVARVARCAVSWCSVIAAPSGASFAPRGASCWAALWPGLKGSTRSGGSGRNVPLRACRESPDSTEVDVCPVTVTTDRLPQTTRSRTSLSGVRYKAKGFYKRSLYER